MPQPKGNKKGKAPAKTTQRKGRKTDHRITPTVLIRAPRKAPTPPPDDEYMETTDIKEVTGPVASMVDEKMVNGWKVNECLPMWLIFDVINPVRQYKRGLRYSDRLEFPAYGPEPWDDLTETDDPPRGWMPFAPISYT